MDRSNHPAKGSAKAGAVVGNYLANQLQTMVVSAAGVRKNEPDSIHDMRVATRRLSNTIATYGKVLDDRHAQDLEVRLKRLALQLGAVRDPEVLLERLESELDAQPPTLIQGSARERLRTKLLTQSQQARAALLEVLDGSAYTGLVAGIKQLVKPSSTTGAARRPARKVLPVLVDRSFRKLARRAEKAVRAPQGEARDRAYHRTRKAAKQLRYAAEVALPVCGSQGVAVASLATRIQEILGEQHDSVIAADFLHRIAVDVASRDGSAFTFGLLVGVEQAKARAAGEEFDKLWKARRD